MTLYDNYIFDLYGTLVDIYADENIIKPWENAAEHLSEEFGTGWTGETLWERYKEITKEEEKKLSARIGAEYPEILIENVWLRLIREGVEISKDNSGKAVSKNMKDESEISRLDKYRKKAAALTVTSPEILSYCTWFREMTRTRFKLFDGVLETFEFLRSNGKKIFLLSNAQRAYTAKELSDVGLDDKFDDIFISSDKEIKKPQKEFLEKLVNENGLSVDKCVMIGNDIFSDVGVAVKNGMNSIYLNTNGYSRKKIDDDIKALGIKGCKLMPRIIEDGDFKKILE